MAVLSVQKVMPGTQLNLIRRTRCHSGEICTSRLGTRHHVIAANHQWSVYKLMHNWHCQRKVSLCLFQMLNCVMLSCCRFLEDSGQPQLKQHSSSGQGRGPLQHMHFNSLFDQTGSNHEVEDLLSNHDRCCTSAQKVQRMPGVSPLLQNKQRTRT